MKLSFQLFPPKQFFYMELFGLKGVICVVLTEMYLRSEINV